MSVGGGSLQFELYGDPRQLAQPLHGLTQQEADDEALNGCPHADAHRDFVGLGFCKRSPRRAGRPSQQVAFFYETLARSKKGAVGEHLIDTRAPEMHLNDENFPYASTPIAAYYDKYNTVGMTSKMRRTPGGTLAC